MSRVEEFDQFFFFLKIFCPVGIFHIVKAVVEGILQSFNVPVFIRFSFAAPCAPRTSLLRRWPQSPEKLQG